MRYQNIHHGRNLALTFGGRRGKNVSKFTDP